MSLSMYLNQFKKQYYELIESSELDGILDEGAEKANQVASKTA